MISQDSPEFKGIKTARSAPYVANAASQDSPEFKGIKTRNPNVSAFGAELSRQP